MASLTIRPTATLAHSERQRIAGRLDPDPAGPRTCVAKRLSEARNEVGDVDRPDVGLGREQAFIDAREDHQTALGLAKGGARLL